MTAPSPPDGIAGYEIISRKEARARGLKRFFTGIPCKEGHICEGVVSGRSCVECMHIHHRNWYYANHNENKERNRKASAEERRHHPEKARQRGRDWRARNPEKARLRARDEARRGYVKRIDKIKKRDRERYYNGPSKPNGEKQWLKKNQILLRNLKRELRNRNRTDCDQPQS